MINLLENLISSLLLPVGFVIDELVIILKNPIGFIAVFSSLSFFEYSTAKSIFQDLKKINIKPALNIVKNYKLLNGSLYTKINNKI